MKKFTIQIVALLIFIFALLIYSTGRIPGIGGGILASPSTNIKTEVIMVNNTKITAEIANTPEIRQKGLSGRDSLASDSGMLFTFDKPGIHPFWMKGMKIPLDFIWVKDQKVVDLIKNIPPPTPNQKDDSLPILQSRQPVDSVLEVNAGFVDSNSVKVGDDIKPLTP